MALDHLEATFNEVLTKRAIGLLQDRADFAVINGAVPMIPTDKISGTFKAWKAEDFRRRNSELRGDTAKFKRVNTHLKDISYTCEEMGYEEMIGDRNRVEGQVEDLSAKMAEDAYATFDIKLVDLLVTGAFGAEYTGHATTPDATHFIQWSEATSTPIADIKKYKAVVKAKIGVNPDSLLLSEDVFIALTENAQILARLRNDADKEVTAQTLAKFFGLKNIYVMAGAETTSNQGQATQTIANIASDIALLYYKGNTVGPVTPSTLKCYYNTKESGPNGVSILDYRDPSIKADILQLVQDFTIVIQMKEGGVLLLDVLK